MAVASYLRQEHKMSVCLRLSSQVLQVSVLATLSGTSSTFGFSTKGLFLVLNSPCSPLTRASLLGGILKVLPLVDIEELQTLPGLAPHLEPLHP